MGRGLAVPLAVFLVGVPFLLTGYWVRVLTDVFMYAILAGAWNLIAGYAGYPAFGNVVFFGTGAYTTAILMVKVDLPFLVSLLAGGLFSFLYAGLLGPPVLRLKGHYFAIATVALDLATREVVFNMTGLTGGGSGLTLPLSPLSPKAFFGRIYFLMLGILLLTILVTLVISGSRFGYGLRAIRADEDGAATLGVNTTLYKTAAWALSALFTGLAGGTYAYWTTYIEPSVVFDMRIAAQFTIMVFLGGAGTVLGPVLGAVILVLLSDLIWSRFLHLHTAILGFIIVLVVVFLPRGLMDFFTGGRFDLASLRRSLQEHRI